MNKNVLKAFPEWTNPFNHLIVDAFVKCISDRYKEDTEIIMDKDVENPKLNEFFTNEEIYVKPTKSWFGRYILPHHYRLNDRMWWFASGWIRCRNTMLSGQDNISTQSLFIGIIDVHEKTLDRLENFCKSKNLDISRNDLKDLHDDLVQHYLKNQDILIGDKNES